MNEIEIVNSIIDSIKMLTHPHFKRLYKSNKCIFEIIELFDSEYYQIFIYGRHFEVCDCPWVTFGVSIEEKKLLYNFLKKHHVLDDILFKVNKEIIDKI